MRAATRASALAQWQTAYIFQLLGEAAVGEPLLVSTTGDQRADVPISTIGGKGVFVKEVQAAVLDGRADIAVHSAKDLPAVTPDGLVIAAVPRRGDPRDALVGGRLTELPKGAVVATGSARRRVQLRELRPDLGFAELRGNIATRLAKAADYHAVVVAKAALDRLGETPAIVDVLDSEVMIPQVGQGALAVECRADDHRTQALLAAVEDRVARLTVNAERAFLSTLGGDCTLPAGAHARLLAEGEKVVIQAVLAEGLDGRLHTVSGEAADGEQLGRDLALQLLAAVAR